MGERSAVAAQAMARWAEAKALAWWGRVRSSGQQARQAAGNGTHMAT